MRHEQSERLCVDEKVKPGSRVELAWVLDDGGAGGVDFGLVMLQAEPNRVNMLHDAAADVLLLSAHQCLRSSSILRLVMRRGIFSCPTVSTGCCN